MFCGFDFFFQLGLVFVNNNLICNSEMVVVLVILVNNKCCWNVIEKCLVLKDINVLKYSYDCQVVFLDEGICFVFEEEVFDIDLKGNNYVMSFLYGGGYFVFIIYLFLVFSIVLFYYM